MQATDAPRRVRVMTRDRRELVGVYDPLQQLILMEMPGGHVSLKLQLTDIVAWLPPPAATPALGGDSDIMPRTINRNSLAALVARLLDRAPPSPGTVIPVAFAWGQLGGVPENGYNLDPKSGAFVSNGYVYGYPQAVKGFHLREDGYNWMRNGEWPPKGFEERFRSLRLRSFALSETPKLVRLRQRMDEDQLISMCSFDLQADAIVTETHVDLVDVVIASDIIVCPSFPKQGRPHTIQAHENP
jgi:hypothetical protein